MQNGFEDIKDCAFMRTQGGKPMMPMVRRSIRSPIIGALFKFDYG